MGQQKRGKMGVSGEALWRFSLALYARPGVAEALIQLQDRAGRDVNLILFAVWLGAIRNQRLDRPGLAAAAAAAAPIARDIVAPVRQLRRQLRGDPAADIQELRQRLLALELAAERRVQYRLAATASGAAGGGDRRSIAEANLTLALGGAAQSPEADLLRQSIAAFLDHG